MAKLVEMATLQPTGFDILYEDGPVLVVGKPAGVATQAPPGLDSLEARIKAFLRDREGLAGNIYLGVPHRLDRPVSGAIVFARHSRAARKLSRQFERRTVGKRYWVGVAGIVEPPAGTWVDHLRKIPELPRGEIVPPDHPDARQAVLHYRTLAVIEGDAWLEIQLETGRMHQIRIQAASRGHPVLGDDMYGSGVPFGPPCDDPRGRAIAVHARELAFLHPMTREPLRIVAPTPKYWPRLSISSDTAGGA